MPRFIDPNGLAQHVPGVYTRINVRRDLPGPLPEFLIPIMVSDAVEGHPYDADSSKQDDEDPYHAFTLMVSSGDTAEYFGRQSDAFRAMRSAKRHGLPFCWVITACALTRASIIASSGSQAVNEAILYPLKWGAPGGHIKLKSASGDNIEITPVANYAMLTADAGTSDTRIYVKGNEWVSDGQSITIGDNSAANTAYTVKTSGSSLDSNGQEVFWIDLTTSLSTAVTVAAYAIALEYDENGTEVSETYTADIGQSIIDWVKENSQYIGATAQGTFTSASLDALAAATAIKDISAWSTAVVGTSPASTTARHNTLITAFDSSIWDDFLQTEQAVPRSFCVTDENSAVQQAWRDWAVARRTAGEAISIDFGTAWGDHVLNAVDDTNPIVRAAALNNQDCALWANGLDRMAAAISLCPAAWALRVAGGVGHNLTEDDLVYSHIERKWNERGAKELTALHKGGVGTIRLSGSAPYNYVISQGLNTYQTNTQDWNESTATTPLIMQRDMADFVDRAFKETMYASELGEDEVNPTSIGASLNRTRLQLIAAGRITDGRINSITLDASGNGYNVDWAVRLPKTADFIGGITTIVIDDA